jgi:hypothetical protein
MPIRIIKRARAPTTAAITAVADEPLEPESIACCNCIVDVVVATITLAVLEVTCCSGKATPDRVDVLTDVGDDGELDSRAEVMVGRLSVEA